VDNFYASDIAIDPATGATYLVGRGYSSESPALGILVAMNFDGSTPYQSGWSATTDVNNGGPVSFDSVAIDADDRAIVGGTFNNQLMVLRTQSASSAPDTSWGSGQGFVTTPIGGSPEQFEGQVAIQSDGKYVLAGQGSDGDQVAGFRPLAAATTSNLLMAARFNPGSVAEEVLTDQEVQDKINNGDLKWYDDNGNPVGNLGSYFTNRISDPNLQNGVLNLNGDNQSGNQASSLAADAITVGNPQDDYFEIGRRFDENGNEYFWVRRSHNENDEGETRQYGIDEITAFNIDGGSGHTKVVVDNALGIPLHITGEEDNVEVIVKTTLFGDPDSGTPRTLDSASDPAHGSTALSGNQITYTPDANYNGDDSFNYTESHPSAGDDSGTIDITLTPVNDAPTDLAVTPASIAENKAVGAQVGVFSATDVDDTTGFTYQLVSGTGSTDNGSFDIVGGALVSKATFNYEAKKTYSVRVRVTDPGGATFDKVLTISILDVAENPTANAGGPYTVATGGSIQLNGSGTDPDANTTLTYKWDFDNDGVFGEASTIYGNENGAAPTFTATNLAAGSVFNVKLKVTDNTGLSDTKTVGITITSNLNRFTGTVIGTTPNATSNSKEKAFDGKLNTYFYGANTAGGAWVGLDMGTKQQVTQIKFAPAYGGTTNMVGGRFQASNDASFSSGVVTIYTITTVPTAGVLTTVTANTPGSFRYYRYVGPAGGVTEVAEIEFYGPTDQVKPSKPGKPSATAINYTSIALSWAASTDNVGVDHYDIYRNGKKVGSSNTNSFTDINLTPNTTYTYTVQAFDANGNASAVSDSLSVATLKDTTGPTKPTNLHAGTITKSSIQLLWNASTDNVAVAYYIVYRNGKQVGTTTSLSFTSTGLATKTNYTFTVQAVDTSGNLSLLSDQIVLKTL
jgi:chitodextrinase